MKIYDIRNKTQKPTQISEGLFDMFGSDPNVHTPSREQKKQTKEREKGVKKLIDRAFDSWRDHVDQVKATLPDDYNGEIPPERLKADLETFIQNNIMGGGQISQASNAADITHYINKLSGVEDEAEEEQPSSQTREPSTTTRDEVPSTSTVAPTQAPTQAPSTSEEPPQTQEPDEEEPATQREPFLKDPNVASSGVIRTSVDPLILKRDGKEYVIDEKTKKWVRNGIKNPEPENSSMSALLNKASAEFSDNDDILGINQPEAEPEGEYVTNPQTGKQEWHATAAPTPADGATMGAAPTGQVEPFQIGAKETGTQAVKRYKNYLSDLKAAGQLSAKQAADLLKAASQQEFELRSQVPLEKPNYPAPKERPMEPGEEPASKGLVNVGGRGQSAQYEPIKESLRRRIASGELTLAEAKKIYHTEKTRIIKEAAEKLGLAKERELFGKLIRAALLTRTPSQPTAQTATPRASTSAPSRTQRAEVEAPSVSRRDLKSVARILGGEREAGKFGNEIRDETGADVTVRSTGNAAADAALMAMGFRVQ